MALIKGERMGLIENNKVNKKKGEGVAALELHKSKERKC